MTDDSCDEARSDRAQLRFRTFMVGSPVWLSSLIFGLIIGGAGTIVLALGALDELGAAGVGAIGALAVGVAAVLTYFWRDDRGLSRHERLARVERLPTVSWRGTLRDNWFALLAAAVLIWLSFR